MNLIERFVIVLAILCIPITICSGIVSQSEVTPETYNEITLWCYEYPAIRPSVSNYLSDNCITYDEYTKIKAEKNKEITKHSRNSLSTSLK